MVEKNNQTAHANEGAEESERGSDQVREWGPWVSPTHNWIKRGHVRAEPETVRARTEAKENEYSDTNETKESGKRSGDERNVYFTPEDRH